MAPGTTRLVAMVETAAAFFRIAEIVRADPRLDAREAREIHDEPAFTLHGAEDKYREYHEHASIEGALAHFSSSTGLDFSHYEAGAAQQRDNPRRCPPPS